MCCEDILLLSCLFLYPYLFLSSLIPSSTLIFVYCFTLNFLSLLCPYLLQLDLARRLEKVAAEKGVKLFLATDVVVADKFAADAAVQVMMSRCDFLLFYSPRLTLSCFSCPSLSTA
jgi:hypothetical protein